MFVLLVTFTLVFHCVCWLIDWCGPFVHWYVSPAFDCMDVLLFTNSFFWLLGFAAEWLFAYLFNWIVGQLIFVVVWLLGCFCLFVGWLLVGSLFGCFC